MKRAALTQPLVATVQEGKRDVRLQGFLDLNGNIHMPSDAAGDSLEGTEGQSCHGENEAALADCELKSQENISQGR